MKNSVDHKNNTKQKALDLNEYIKGLCPTLENSHLAFHFVALNDAEIGLKISINFSSSLQREKTLKSFKLYEEKKLRAYLLALKKSLIFGQEYWTECEISIDYRGGHLLLSASILDSPDFTLDTILIISKMYGVWEENSCR